MLRDISTMLFDVKRGILLTNLKFLLILHSGTGRLFETWSMISRNPILNWRLLSGSAGSIFNQKFPRSYTNKKNRLLKREMLWKQHKKFNLQKCFSHPSLYPSTKFIFAVPFTTHFFRRKIKLKSKVNCFSGI